MHWPPPCTGASWAGSSLSKILLLVEGGLDPLFSFERIVCTQDLLTLLTRLTKTLLGAEVRPTPTSQESEIGLQVCAQRETGKQSPDPGGDAHPHLGRPQGGVNISQEKGIIQDTQESRDLEVGERGR